MTASKATEPDLEVSGYDFLDFGCSTGGSLDFARRVFGGQRGLGIDADPGKVEKSKAAGHEAVMADITRLAVKGRVRFVIMSHFLEHLAGLDDGRRCISTAVNCASDFVIIQQPYFDADGYLFDLGLKLYWSDWTAHKTNMTSLQLMSILRTLRDAGRVAEYVVGRRIPVVTSADPCVHPLGSPANQHDWSEDTHPQKTAMAFENRVFREVFAFAFLGDGNIDDTLRAFFAKRGGEITFDSRAPRRIGDPARPACVP